MVRQILAKEGKESQAYKEAWELARLNKEAYFVTRNKAEAMKEFRTWYKCTKTYQEIMSRNYDRIQIFKGFEANIMAKIKFRQAWTDWSRMDTYDIVEPFVYIQDDGAKVKDKSSDQFWLVELSSGREVLIPMEGIPRRTLELMRADADEPLGAVDQWAEDNRNAMVVNAEAIMRSPTLQAQQEAQRVAKEAIRNRKFKSNSVRKAPSPSQLMKIGRGMLQVKRSLVDRSEITGKKHQAEKEALSKRPWEETRRSTLSLEAAKRHLKEARKAITRSRSPSPTGPLERADTSQAEQVRGSNVTQAQQWPSQVRAIRSELEEQDDFDMTQSAEMASPMAKSTGRMGIQLGKADQSKVSQESDDELYDVAEILDHVGKASKLKYFCSFVDYGPEDNCYVQADEMNGCDTLISQYWASKDAEREEF